MAKILWIGAGNMGYPIAMNLVAAGHDVAVHDTDAEKVAKAVAGGASAAGDVLRAAAEADFVFTSVPNSEALQNVVLGANGVARAITGDRILVDTSTVSVESSRLCATAIAAAGGKFLRAPVNGSTVFASEGKLTVICSGPRDAYEKALPLFERISQHRFYLGEGEQARIMKLAINLMVATTSAMFSEAAVLCEKAGMEWNTALDVFLGSVIASPQLGFKIPPLRNRDFTPAFTTRLMAKDVGLALDAAKELGVFTPVTAIVKQILEATIARGSGDRDFSSMLETIEALSDADSSRFTQHIA